MATPKEIIDMTTRMTAIAFATHPISVHMCIRSIPPIRQSSATGTKSIKSETRSLLQCEVHRDGHDDRHGNAVQQGRCERPLLDCVERCLVEQRDRSQNLCVL